MRDKIIVQVHIDGRMVQLSTAIEDYDALKCHAKHLHLSQCVSNLRAYLSKPPEAANEKK